MSEKIYIIGGGIAGLIAAQHLEKAGRPAVILEGTDRVGGRVKTDHHNGFLLDHGFQVLLTAYDEARRYLDFKALDLKRFYPGAEIFSEGRRFQIGDPLRNPAVIFSMLFSPVGSLKDKFLVWKLTQQLKRTNAKAIFDKGTSSTMTFLKDYGFSDSMIQQFFKPFFGGIFLENELRTGSAMFRFVFKMFSEGEAAIPAEGMEQIPIQLRHQLERTKIQYHTRVQRIDGQNLLLEGGDQLDFDKVIIATDPTKILPNLKSQELDYVQTANLYFRSKKSVLSSPIIALVADQENPINNFCVLTDVSSDYADGEEALISVTLKENITLEGEEQQLAEALAKLTGNAPDDFEFISRYDIPHALPVIEAMAYDIQPESCRLTDRIFTAGDYLLNASLDASMRSGRRAAESVLIN